MKKYLFLTMLLSFTLLFSQIPQEHDIFYYWDMDKWDNYNDGQTPWHDMDFFCSPKDGYNGYWWRLEVGNSSGLYSSAKLEVDSKPLIKPMWLSPSESVSESTSESIFIEIPFGFMPTYFNIYFYEGGGENYDISLTKFNQSINLNSIYLFDLYNYYKSEIQTFSATVDEQTGNINLSATILQPEWFYLTVKINDMTYSGIEDEEFKYTYNSGWERGKIVDDMDIDYAWLGTNHFIGSQTKIELILKSEMWGPLPSGVIGWYTAMLST